MTPGGGWKDAFDLGDSAYLNGASHGPAPRVAADAVAEALEWKRNPSTLDDSLYFTLPDRVRRAAAPLFGCDPRNVAVCTGASTGINLMVAGLDWRAGDEVIVPAAEFPANYLPWLSLQRLGVAVKVVEPTTERGVTVGDLEAAIGDRTRVVSVGHVNFATGHRVDIDAVGELCAGRGIGFVVDASQSLAAVPLDVRRCGAAIVVAAGYKWLCSPYGTGLFAIDPGWIERLRPPLVNWESVEGAENFNDLTSLELRYRPGAARYDAPETASFLNLNAMAASIEFLADIGPERVLGHATGLLDRLVEGLPEGFRVDGPVRADRRSTILRVVGADADRTRRAFERAIAGGVSVSLREGGIRVSPGVWNDRADVDRLLDRLS